MVFQVPPNKALYYWLFGTCFLIWLMIMLGGATRLTHAGLSIVEWKPVTGIVPPLNAEAWAQAFEAYKRYPEYQQVNKGMTLESFQFIYYMEYAHRLLGRLIGLWFGLPLLYFWKKGCLSPALKKRLAVVLALGFLQGFIGWYMVKSGLDKDPTVSHYRLTVHLGLAVTLYAILLWTAFAAAGIRTFPLQENQTTRIRHLAITCCTALSLTILYGGLVAGLKAGLIYNTFPLMEGRLIPAEWNFHSPLWINFSENPAMVQWLHRWLGIGTFGIVLVTAWKAWLISSDRRMHITAFLLAGTTCLQAVLGILTLLNHVPAGLGILHQGNAMVVLTVGIYMLYLGNAGEQRKADKINLGIAKELV